MYLTKEIKKKIFKSFGKSDKDTGSAESQIALFSHRMNVTLYVRNTRGILFTYAEVFKYGTKYFFNINFAYNTSKMSCSHS